MRKLIAADLFCGAGGTSQGAEQSGAATVRFAVNHWKIAVDTHSANFPHAQHVNSRLDQCSPSEVDRIDLLFASPECTHHSRARGGRPTTDQQRSGAWQVLPWIEHHRPSFVVIENVIEFREWGPVGDDGRPLSSKRGETFSAWLSAIRSLGYRVDHRELNAADHGAATSRNRLFVIARKGNRSPVFPEPTHSRAAPAALPGMALKPWHAAAEVIDWSIACPSIFARSRPLADKTLLRIEAGLRRFAGPFVAQWDNHGGNGLYARDAQAPLGTMTTKANMGLVIPFQVVLRNNQHSASAGDPVGTICASGAHHGLALPFVVPFRGERDGQSPRTHDPTEPLPTITTEPGAGVALPFLADVNHSGDESRTVPLTNTLGSVTTHNGKAIVVPWIAHYYGTDNQSPVTEPVDTITTKARHSLCVAICRGPDNWPPAVSDAMRKLQATMRELGIADVLFRMLQNHELSAAQGFPRSYIFCGNKAEVTRQIGNSVSPPVASAITTRLAG